MVAKYTHFFTISGVEKNNDVCKKLYFSSNRHDPAAEILVARQRLETLSSHKTNKWKYTKHDNDYWSEGISERRKIRRLSNHSTTTLNQHNKDHILYVILCATDVDMSTS